MRLLLLIVGLAAAAEVGPGVHSPHPSQPESATRNAPSAGGEASAPSSRRRYSDDAAATTAPPRQDFERKRASAQVIRDKKEAEQVAKKLFKDHKKDRSPKKVKDARKAFKKEEAVKLTRGGAPPIPKPPSGEPPSEEEARRRPRRLMRRMSRKRKGKKHRKSKAFKKGML